jgi:hypothetical protein
MDCLILENDFACPRILSRLTNAACVVEYKVDVDENYRWDAFEWTASFWKTILRARVFYLRILSGQVGS